MVSKDTHFDAALVPSASERGGRLSKNDHLAEFLFSARFFNVTFCSTSVYFGLSFTSILIRIFKVRFTHFGFVLRSFNFPPSGWAKLKVRKTESEQTHHPGATVVHGYVK